MNDIIFFAISFVAGILTVLAPCILPLLPIIVGGSIQGGKNLARATTVISSLAVSIIVFTLLIKVSTAFINVPQTFWTWLSGGIILIFGVIALVPEVWEKLPFMAKMNIVSNKALSAGFKKHNTVGDIIMGASLGPVFSTCSPTYFLVLAAVLPKNFALGMVYLIAYAAGLSISLFVVAILGQKIVDKTGYIANPHGLFKRLLGVLFIIVGLAVITGFDKTVEARLIGSTFDITRVEQKLLSFVSSDRPSIDAKNPASETTDMKLLSPEEKAARYTLAPDISTPDGFINTDGKPISLADLRGKVVLLDIWTYSCINCQRTLPYLNAWYEKYKDQGLVIIGLHTPEFSFERVQSNVEKAVKDFGIQYPVVLDNDYSTWNAYGNQYWPRKYLIDMDGYVVYDHIGEGGYEETEKAIQHALEERATRLGSGPVSENISDPTNAISSDAAKVSSPETYFGAFRNTYLANGTRGTVGTQTFSLPALVMPNLLYLDGSWNIQNEYASGDNGSAIVFKYSAKNVYMVAGSTKGGSISIYQDGTFVKTLDISDQKLYPIIEGSAYGNHILRIELHGPVDAFTFTFG